ncbi:Na(+)/H(+) antiporter subunit C [Thermopolyspora sp. NPDC052614]|uniref:Na(+)/H(+) antiporter subunit C n=1 Tax=Thermopolyspora sp. NPDC052614 TaxID=3155682 RepID=UPI00342CCF22
MTPNLVYVVTVGVLFATGVTLLLERSLTRVLMGVILLGNGANLLILSGGRLGGPPIVGVTPQGGMSDPLPQAMILTAIVITLGMSAFLLAMAYRSWQLVGHDEVRDDVEDRRIVALAERDRGLDGDEGGDTDDTGAVAGGDAGDIRAGHGGRGGDDGNGGAGGTGRAETGGGADSGSAARGDQGASGETGTDTGDEAGDDSAGGDGGRRGRGDGPGAG